MSGMAPTYASYDSPCQLQFLRGMLHDPNIFTDPDRFDPERWFSPTAPAYPIQAFGFGPGYVPVVSSPAGACGRLSLEY